MHYFRSKLLVILLMAPSVVGCARIPTAAPTPTHATAMAAATHAPSIPSATPTRTETPLAAGLSIRKLTVGALDRSYYLYVPRGFDAAKPIPVVMVFHHHKGEGASMVNVTEFDKLAESDLFLAVYPNGSGPSDALSWNAGGCCGYARENNIDDYEFVRRILADLERWAEIDPDRIYATGLSNGGILAYRLACGMSETFAAIAPVAATLFYDGCRPSRPVSVIHFHGSADDTVPFAGRNTDDSYWPPVEKGIAAWAGFDRCEQTPQTERSGIVTRTFYTHCADGTSVELFLLKDLGHQWPTEIVWSTSRTIWDFFNAHPKKPA
jgi:polyhydroxybutyrate depolymerase